MKTNISYIALIAALTSFIADNAYSMNDDELLAALNVSGKKRPNEDEDGSSEGESSSKKRRKERSAAQTSQDFATLVETALKTLAAAELPESPNKKKKPSRKRAFSTGSEPSHKKRHKHNKRNGSVPPGSLARQLEERCLPSSTTRTTSTEELNKESSNSPSPIEAQAPSSPVILSEDDQQIADRLLKYQQEQKHELVKEMAKELRGKQKENILAYLKNKYEEEEKRQQEKHTTEEKEVDSPHPDFIVLEGELERVESTVSTEPKTTINLKSPEKLAIRLLKSYMEHMGTYPNALNIFKALPASVQNNLRDYYLQINTINKEEFLLHPNFKKKMERLFALVDGDEFLKRTAEESTEPQPKKSQPNPTIELNSPQKLAIRLLASYSHRGRYPNAIKIFGVLPASDQKDIRDFYSQNENKITQTRNSLLQETFKKKFERLFALVDEKQTSVLTAEDSIRERPIRNPDNAHVPVASPYFPEQISTSPTNVDKDETTSSSVLSLTLSPVVKIPSVLPNPSKLTTQMPSEKKRQQEKDTREEKKADSPPSVLIVLDEEEVEEEEVGPIVLGASYSLPNSRRLLNDDNSITPIIWDQKALAMIERDLNNSPALAARNPQQRPSFQDSSQQVVRTSPPPSTETISTPALDMGPHDSHPSKGSQSSSPSIKLNGHEENVARRIFSVLIDKNDHVAALDILRILNLDSQKKLTDYILHECTFDSFFPYQNEARVVLKPFFGNRKRAQSPGNASTAVGTRSVLPNQQQPRTQMPTAPVAGAPVPPATSAPVSDAVSFKSQPPKESQPSSRTSETSTLHPANSSTKLYEIETLLNYLGIPTRDDISRIAGRALGGEHYLEHMRTKGTPIIEKCRSELLRLHEGYKIEGYRVLKKAISVNTKEQNIVNWSMANQDKLYKGYLKSKGCSAEVIDKLMKMEKELEELNKLTSSHEEKLRNAKDDQRGPITSEYFAHLDHVKALNSEIEKTTLGDFKKHLKKKEYSKEMLDHIKKGLQNRIAKDGIITLNDIKAVLKKKMNFEFEEGKPQ